MSRDKYSNNHTITVNEGTGTLTVNADLSVSGDLSVTGDIALTAVNLETAITQKLRIPGLAFRALDTTDLSHISYSATGGRLNFTSTNAKAIAPINLMHGAIVSAIRIVGNAQGASDSLNIKFVNSLHSDPVDETYTNEGNIDVTVDLSSNYTVDYSLSDVVFLYVSGTAATTSAYLNFIDVIYSIQNFPQDTSSTPV